METEESASTERPSTGSILDLWMEKFGCRSLATTIMVLNLDFVQEAQEIWDERSKGCVGHVAFFRFDKRRAWLQSVTVVSRGLEF